MNKTDVDYDDVALYDYKLPRELIAQHPLENRIDARLLRIDRQTGEINHYHVRDLPDLLGAGDALVVNNSKVIAARLIGNRASTAGRWEGLFLQSDEHGNLELLSKTRGRLRSGESINLIDHEGRDVPALEVVTKLDNGHIVVRCKDDPKLVGGVPMGLLDRFGRVPLPPYIRDGQMVDRDRESYQTVYAEQSGSVAAPTAGLHFTNDLLNSFRRKTIDVASVTLHVGLGTFRPISCGSLSEHQMHSEWGELSEATCQSLQQCRENDGRVIAVGTTSMRVLESAASLTGQAFAPWSGKTDLFIKPPYDFMAVDCLMTNFHLPKSTLMALVCAFGGYETVLRAYQEAIAQKYRFYSYGDCMLIV